mmetsp:Transcript_11294/g.16908  ORF Transcript_11294/g.16908 Transcript_11294/m.16908 type:complete len:112 (+) Transcript_11294:35-370(+)
MMMYASLAFALPLFLVLSIFTATVSGFQHMTTNMNKLIVPLTQKSNTLRTFSVAQRTTTGWHGIQCNCADCVTAHRLNCNCGQCSQKSLSSQLCTACLAAHSPDCNCANCQ